jgi:ribosomal protein L7/L12
LKMKVTIEVNGNTYNETIEELRNQLSTPKPIKKIPLIKYVKNEYDLGLKDAKDLVEYIISQVT